MMKILITLLICLYTLMGYTQEIFSYERKVDSLGIYQHKDYTILNDLEKTKLSGTLIIPDTDYSKIAIIIPGSGKDTRHSHFVLAEQLLQSNIAVFRFDERGIGKSEGKYSELASDLSEDLTFCYNALRNEFKEKKIGFIGHSLGGMAALGTLNGACRPEFLVLIETPVAKNGEFILNQIEADYENSIPDVMKKGKSKTEVLSFLKSYFEVISKDSLASSKEYKRFIKDKGFNSKFIILMDDPFLMEMLHLNQESIVEKSAVPTLYLTGTKNKVMDYERETSVVAAARNNNITIKVFEGLNHWLTERNAKVGSSLYAMDNEPLQAIIDWIVKQ